MNNEIVHKIRQAIKKILYSSTFKDAGVYTLANFINYAIPFFLMPVFTRYLTPEDYGVTVTFGIIVAICIPLITLNVQSAISVKYFKIDEYEFPKYISNCLFLTIFSCLIITVIFVVFNSQIEKISVFPGGWLWTVIVVSFGNNVIEILLTIFRLKKKPYYYAAMQILFTALNIGLSVWFVVNLNMNWQGRITAYVIAVIFFAVISLIILTKNGWLMFRYSFTYIKDAFKFGSPLLTDNFSVLIISSFDRFIIAQLIGIKELGIYSVGVSFGLVISAVISAVNATYSPWLFKKLKTANEKLKTKIVLLSYGYMIFLLILSLVISSIMPVVLKIFVGAKFHGAIEIIFWILLANAFKGMVVTMSNFIVYAERTHAFMPVNVFVSLLYIGLCYLLTKEMGIAGAAVAFTAVHFIKFLLVWFVSNKVYPMPWFSFYKEILRL